MAPGEGRGFEAAYARRVEIAAAGATLPLASIEDLIAMKRMPGCEQDRSDVEALTRLRGLKAQGHA